MRLNTSYKQILQISAPIMLGSAAQNIIALSDNFFLYHLSSQDFAAIGFIGVFYLVIAAIGYGFSKGGQIMIARRMGEGSVENIGNTFYALVYFELILAAFFFLFMRYGCPYFLDWLIDSEVIYTKSLEYLSYRSWGVFFSYMGVAIIALYTGVARATFIIIDTLILAVVNIILNYALIFGKWGLPEMGIGGAGLASTLAEIVAFVVFFIYMLFDKKAVGYQLFKLPKFDFPLISQLLKLSSPIVAQSVVGLGSWLVFFSLVEKMGEQELAVTNLVQKVYLILSIPCWGFAAGINTLVSNFIGHRKRMAVEPIIWKTAYLNLFVTLLISIPVVLFPHEILYPLVGSENPELIEAAKPILKVLFGILTFFSIGAVLFNGLAGTGATIFGLKMQFICAAVYLAYVYISIHYFKVSLSFAWGAEIIYWIMIIVFSYIYLRSKKWHGLQV